MSFLITVYTSEAVVMAADSRITYDSSHYTDNAQKLFCTESGVGISVCGNFVLGGKLLEVHMREICAQNPTTSPEGMITAIKKHFEGLKAEQDTTFFITGYENGPNGPVQKVFRIKLNNNIVEVPNAKGPGAAWDGQTDIISRLFTDLYIKRNENGKDVYVPHMGFSTAYQLYTVQDAVDFAVKSTKIVKDVLSLQNRQVNVGGPTDVLVITPQGSKWIARKELHA